MINYFSISKEADDEFQEMKNKICIHKKENGYCIICNCYPDKEYCDSCIGKEIKK